MAEAISSASTHARQASRRSSSGTIRLAQSRRPSLWLQTSSPGWKGGWSPWIEASWFHPRGRGRYARGMCRNIKLLHHFEPPATEAEIRDSALQYVRKLSGMREPSRANRVAFARAVDEITASVNRL